MTLAHTAHDQYIATYDAYDPEVGVTLYDMITDTPELGAHLVSGPDMEIHFDDGSWVDTDGNPHGIDLVSQPDIAERLGVATNTVHVWRQRHKDFPVPEWTVGQSPVWRWEVIEQWARDNGRL